MLRLKASIHLRSYAQKNPLQQYIEEAAILFDSLKSEISHEMVTTLITARTSAAALKPLHSAEIEDVQIKLG